LCRLVSDLLTTAGFLPWWGYSIGLAFLLVGLALVRSFPLKVVLDKCVGTCVATRGWLIASWRKRIPLSRVCGVSVASEKRGGGGGSRGSPCIYYVHCLRLETKNGTPVFLRESDSPQEVVALAEKIRDYLDVPLSKSLVISDEGTRD